MRQSTWTAYPSYSSPWSPPSSTWWAGCSARRPPVAAGWPAASGNCTSECFWRRSPASPRLSSFLLAPPSSQPGAPSVPSDLQNYRKQSVRWMWGKYLSFRITVANVSTFFSCFKPKSGYILQTAPLKGKKCFHMLSNFPFILEIFT